MKTLAGLSSYSTLNTLRLLLLERQDRFTMARTSSISALAPPITSIVSLRSHRYGHDPSRYPLKAIPYVLSHSSLWMTVFKVACCGCIISTIVLLVLLITTLKLQAEMISANLEWWAWLIAFFAVLLEAAICATLLMAVSQSRAQTNAFVETMRLEGRWKEDMVKQPIIKDLNLVKKAFVVRIITLPLQIIPLAGGILYSAINMTFTGWDYMDRYFDAIRLPTRMQRIEVFGQERSDCSALIHPSTYDGDNDYARFGFMCSFLESFPIFGWTIAPITNAVAAALFACDIEACGGLVCLRNEHECVAHSVDGNTSK